MKEMSLRERIMIIVLVAVLLFAGYYNFFFSGFLEDNAYLDERIERLEQSLLEAKAKATQLEGAEEELEEIEKGIALFDRDMLPGFDRPYLLGMLEETAYPGLEDTVVSFYELRENLEYAHIHGIEISFQSDYDTFIGVLENLRRESTANRVINASLRMLEEEGMIFNARITVEILTDTADMAEFKR